MEYCAQIQVIVNIPQAELAPASSQPVKRIVGPSLFGQVDNVDPQSRGFFCGSTPEIAEQVDQLYRQIITAGTFKASSIKVAEAAKVIENTMPAPGQYAAIVLAVSHHQFVALGESGLKAFGIPNAVLFDVKSILPLGAADGRL